jgi:hypothetical protein
MGPGLEHKHVVVNPATCETSIPGIHAIGDVATYPGKLKLILQGFSEAAMAAHAITRASSRRGAALRVLHLQGRAGVSATVPARPGRAPHPASPAAIRGWPVPSRIADGARRGAGGHR